MYVEITTAFVSCFSLVCYNIHQMVLGQSAVLVITFRLSTKYQH